MARLPNGCGYGIELGYSDGSGSGFDQCGQGVGYGSSFGLGYGYGTIPDGVTYGLHGGGGRGNGSRKHVPFETVNGIGYGHGGYLYPLNLVLRDI
jgi:hypothetical protein